MNKIDDLIDYGLIATGTLVSLENIETMLGIAILIIQFIWLVTKLVVKAIGVIKKDGDLNELDKEVDNIVDFVEDALNKDDKENKDDNKQC